MKFNLFKSAEYAWMTSVHRHLNVILISPKKCEASERARPWSRMGIESRPVSVDLNRLAALAFWNKSSSRLQGLSAWAAGSWRPRESPHPVALAHTYQLGALLPGLVVGCGPRWRQALPTRRLAVPARSARPVPLHLPGSRSDRTWGLAPRAHLPGPTQ